MANPLAAVLLAAGSMAGAPGVPPSEAPRAAAGGLAGGATGLVDAAVVVPGAVLEIRYATARNPAGRPLYPVARCLLLRPVAERLAAVARRLRGEGYRLVLWDCYRPTSAHAELWRAVPRAGAVADPAHGSHHSRGAAVDLSLADLEGASLAMPTDHDAFGPRAHASALEGVPEPARRRRDALRQAMEAEGFVAYEREWWHFAARDARRFPLLDEPIR